MASSSSERHRTANILERFRDVDQDAFRELTAREFLEVWSHYDRNENGYIEGAELDRFFRDLVGILDKKDVHKITEDEIEMMRDMLLTSLDANRDGKIEITELGSLLPTDENFLHIFRRDQTVPSSVTFMRIWRQFDKDSSGYIDVEELKDFIKEIKICNGQTVTDKELKYYAKSMLRMFDKNKDGKLQLSEMSKLLPTDENHLRTIIFKKNRNLTDKDIEKVFTKYDHDNNGYIENEELEGFFKDLMELMSEDYELEHVRFMKEQIMKHWDLDHDGRIDRNELRMLLIQQKKMAGEIEGWPEEAGPSGVAATLPGPPQPPVASERSRSCSPQPSITPSPSPSAALAQ